MSACDYFHCIIIRVEEQLLKSHNDICIYNTAGKVLVGNVANSVYIIHFMFIAWQPISYSQYIITEHHVHHTASPVHWM